MHSDMEGCSMEHPANLVVSSRYDGCTMVQPYIKCTNTYCFT